MSKNEIDKAIDNQTVHCCRFFLSKQDWYKFLFVAIIWLIAFLVPLCGGVVYWSYGPIKDIATLKATTLTVDDFNAKMDTLITRIELR